LVGKEKSAEEEARGRVTDPAKAPEPPDGEGPLLVWFQASRKRALLTTAWGIPLYPLGVTILQGFSVEWMKYWQPWVVLPFLLIAVYSSFRTAVCAAGADWLKVGKSWVRLYELVEVTAKHRSNALYLDFKDGAGRELGARAQDLQGTRELWDLVYNGIVHSVIAGGAKTNGLVHKVFEVPQPDPRKR